MKQISTLPLIYEPEWGEDLKICLLDCAKIALKQDRTVTLRWRQEGDYKDLKVEPEDWGQLAVLRKIYHG